MLNVETRKQSSRVIEIFRKLCKLDNNEILT